MPTRPRWIVSGLLLAGSLGLLAGAGLALRQHSGQLTYAVPPGHADNALTLRASGPNLLLLDGATQAVLQRWPLAGTDGVTIQGQPGNADDALTVDLSGGALALPDGIHFDGGAGGFDTLVMTGGEAAPGSYAATGPGAGVITHAGTRVFFSNLEPITDSTHSDKFTIIGTGANNIINIVNGGSCGAGCRTTQVNSPSFESFDFANKTIAIVAGIGGADTFTLNNNLPATGLSELVLDGGGNPGDKIGITSFVLPSGTLSLTNAITVSQSGAFSVNNLVFHVAGPVSLPNSANHVGTLAGVTTALVPLGPGFDYVDSGHTTIGTVDGLNGLFVPGGDVSVVSRQGGLTVHQAVLAGGGAIHLNANESAGSTDDLTVDPGVRVESASDNVTLLAGDHLSLEAGSHVEASGAGNAFIDFSFLDSDNLGGGTIAGTVTSASHIPQATGGNADETLLFDFHAGAHLPLGLTYDGGLGQNAVTFSDAGGSSPHQYNTSGTFIARNLADGVEINRVQLMTAIGGSGADIFNIIPDAGVVMHAIGGLPGSAPGDSLFVNFTTVINPVLSFTSLDATGQSGQWTFGNRLPVEFNGIDTFANLSHHVQLPLIVR